MTFREHVRSTLARITTTGSAYRVEYLMDSLVDPDCVMVTLRAWVNERDTGKESAVIFPRTLRGPMPEGHLLLALHGLFLEFLEHEAGEVWLVDGKRPYDPHTSSFAPLGQSAAELSA